ncbi:MAG: S41 family peptidase [Salinivirgaceae bacterium]|jgi:hypothetical protein
MKTFLISLFLFFTSDFIVAQNFNSYQEDFIQLADLVQTSHPASDSLKITLLNSREFYIRMLDSCDNSDDFEIIAQTYLARLKDGHSCVTSGEAYTRKGRYPIKFGVVNGELFISNYPKEIPVSIIGSKVVSINGVPIDTIANRAKRYISFDNDAGFYDWFHSSIKQVSFLELCGVDVNTEYSIGIEGGEFTEFVWKRDLNTSVYSVKLGDKVYTPNIKKLAYHKVKENKLTGWSGNLFEYTVLKDLNTCYFKFSECADIQYVNANPGFMKPLPDWLIKFFWYFRGGDFHKFLRKMFNNIEDSHIDNLVIDLRENKGGTSILGYQLLDYLTDIEKIDDYSESIMLSDLLRNNHPAYFSEILLENNIDTSGLKVPIMIEPKKSSQDEINKYLRAQDSPYFQSKPKQKFTGNVFVLVSNDTFSSAAMLAVLLSDNNIAKTVGNAISTNPSHYGEVLEFTLKNTGVQGTLSCKIFIRPATGKGISELPIDIRISNSVLDTHNGNDKEFETLIKTISKI